MATSRRAIQSFRAPFNTHRPYSSSRRIEIPPPFPVVPSCPEPTCSCAEMPAGLEIDRSRSLLGTMAPYSQQVLISTGQSNWRSRIEEDGLDKGWGILGSRLKKLVTRGGKYADPYNNLMITNSSFKPTNQVDSESSASAFLFPSFRHIPNIPLDEDGLERFVKAFLLPRQIHKGHDILPEQVRAEMTRVPELQSTFPGRTNQLYSPTVLICGHGDRDQRCGIMGPLLEAEFRRVLQDAGFAIGTDNVDAKDHANIGQISHIGGHKWAGNVIIYMPPQLGSNSNASSALAGKGVWYGRVEPRHVEGIVQETIIKGRVITDHFRGGIGEDGEILRI